MAAWNFYNALETSSHFPSFQEAIHGSIVDLSQGLYNSRNYFNFLLQFRASSGVLSIEASNSNFSDSTRLRTTSRFP